MNKSVNAKNKTLGYDVVVTGGGAAGSACAIMLARRGLKVCVLESGARVCAKLAATGNGRCNASNADISPDRYNAPGFVSAALGAFGLDETRRFFASLGVALRESEGRVYPYGNNSGCVVNAFVYALDDCDVRVSSRVISIARGANGLWEVTAETDGVRGVYTAPAVVFACGSNATSGTDSLSLLTALGIERTDVVPSIAPMPSKAFKGTSGVRAFAEGTLFADGKEVARKRGETLMRDDAVSGMLAMELSSAYARALRRGARSFKLRLDFAPDFDDREIKAYLRRSVAPDARGALTGFVPRALGEKLASLANISQGAATVDCEDALCAALRPVIAIEGLPSIRQAQVVCGGLNLAQFDPATMAAKSHRGLYAIGEALDVDGDCGGYNLQWAWSSAAACARAIAEGRA